jgi:hypothetical protein
VDHRKTNQGQRSEALLPTLHRKPNKTERHDMYTHTPNGISRRSPKGEEQLTNFDAQIVSEIHKTDAQSEHIEYEIAGQLGNDMLPNLRLQAAEFAQMQWVTRWGTRPLILPTPGAERHAKTAIQLNSKPTIRRIYTHTGWNPDRTAFMANGGAMTIHGHDTTFDVELPFDLAGYRFAPGGTTPADVQASFFLIFNCESCNRWPLLLAPYRAPIRPTDFSIHISGKSGTFKSELAACLQSHFGHVDARHLPGNWGSTPNALEALAYRAKDVLFTIDDYVPTGTQTNRAALNKAADQLFRGAGNQAGRARLTDTSGHQNTMYPRGMILSTGEDIPEGTSMRSRILILEQSPGDITPEALTQMQNFRPRYSAAMGSWIRHLIANPDIPAQHEQETNALRAGLEVQGHTRTASIAADLITTAKLLIEWACGETAMTPQRGETMYEQAREDILNCANQQIVHTQDQDPTTAFLDAVNAMLQGHIAHVRTRDGGVPRFPERLGWTTQESVGEMPTYRAHGTQIGWIDWRDNSLYLDIQTHYKLIQKHAGGTIFNTKPTMIKRLKESGLITKHDDARQRNTIRIVCEGHTRTCVCLDATKALNMEGESLEI